MCVSAEVKGDAHDLNQLAITLTDSNITLRTPDPAAPFSLPVRLALLLPQQTIGTKVGLHVEGLGGLTSVGDDESVDIPQSGRASVTFTLHAESSPDGGSGDGGQVVPCDPKGMSGPACRWRWSTPLPQGDEIIDVVALADNDIFAVTHADVILHRDASAWSVLPASPGKLLPRSMAASGNHLFVVGLNQDTNTPVIAHSSDHGTSWTQETILNLQAGGGNEILGIATDGMSGIAVGESGNILTRDTTGTWTAIGFGSPNVTSFNAVAMSTLVNVAVGYTSGSALIVSQHVGGTWAQGTITPSLSTRLSSVCSGTSNFSITRFWAVGPGGAIVESDDGDNWTQQASNTSSELFGCTASDANNVWAFGRDGVILNSTDGGAHWSGQTSGVSLILEGGSRGPGTSLTLVGEEGIILRSTNGGASFTSERTGSRSLIAAFAKVATGTVYGVGYQGAILLTTDDGVHFNQLTNTNTTQSDILTGVWGSSASDVYVIGLGGLLLHSTDGSSFTPLDGSPSIPAAEDLLDITGTTSGDVYVVGRDGLYRTSDQGKSWNSVTIPNLSGTATCVFAVGNDVWAGGTAGQVFHSPDGTTWMQGTITGLGGMADLVHITGRSATDLYATYGAALMAHTSDGNQWETVMPFGNAQVISVGPVPGSSGLYATAIGGVLYAADGASFSEFRTGIGGENQITVFPAAENSVFLSANGILHYGN